MPIYKKYNKEFFKKWSPDMAYILGFLYADGNIVKTKRGTHYISFYTADRDLLVSVAEIMELPHKISERKSETGSVYRIQIGSREMFNDLVKIGLTPNKSLRMDLPVIPKQYEGDFVRGFFDGDGNIWVGCTHKTRKKPTPVMFAAFTSASKMFLNRLAILLGSVGLEGGSLFKLKEGNYCRLQYSTLDSLKIYKIMYNTPSKLFLHRKKLIFERFIELRL
jgi:intein-encoded DNA endonuclease-like protein